MDKSFKGTKLLIFDTALLLIAELGYENTSMRDIAEQINIRQSSIYNHFSSKEDILNCIYDFYEVGHMKGYRSLEQVKSYIGFKRVSYIYDQVSLDAWELDDKKNMERITLASKIVYRRMYSEKRAFELFESLNERWKKYVKELLEYGIEIERIYPCDTEGLSEVFVNQAIFYNIRYFATDDPMVSLGRVKEKMVTILNSLLPLNEAGIRS